MTYKRQSSISNSATELHNYDLIDGIVVRIGEQYKPPPRISVDPQRLASTVPAEELLAFEYDFRVENDFLALYKTRWQAPDVNAESTANKVNNGEVEANGDDELEQLRRWQEQTARIQTDELDAARSWHLNDSEATTPKSRYISHSADPPSRPAPPVIPYPFNSSTMTTLLIPNKNPSPVNFNNNQSVSDAVNASDTVSFRSDTARFVANRNASPQHERKPSLRLEDFEPSANPFDSMELTSLDDRKELESILSSSSSSSAATSQTPTINNSVNATTHRR